MKHVRAILLLMLFSSCSLAPANEEILQNEETGETEQELATGAFVTKSITFFGAKGDGKTNDHDAFEKAAAFFNERGGNGKLIIPRGTYLVGKQTASEGKPGQAAFNGFDVLHFANVKNLTISGEEGARLKYANGLRFGAFDPTTGEAYKHPTGNFADYKYAAFLGDCLSIENSTNIKVEGFEIDGNNTSLKYGGSYGDVGIQLPHNGIFIWNCRQVVITNMKVHHLALDGMTLGNAFKDNTQDQVEISHSRFEYNGRQGLSWIGGNGLKVTKSAFNHSGRAGISSAPGAGVDIEAEVGPIANGSFEECEFINNTGVGMVADSGESRDCSFTKCTFWGVTAWSVWVVKPNFTFKECNIYGSFVHGYDAPDNNSATKFYSCNFEDKPYEGKSPYGAFLIEVNNRKRLLFDNCTFTVNQKKLSWLAQPAAWKPEEKYQFNKCTFIVKNAHYPNRDWVALIRGIRYKDCTFDFQHPDAKAKGYWLNACCEAFNVDLGGNKTIFASK
jgi:hypothetical protein